MILEEVVVHLGESLPGGVPDPEVSMLNFLYASRPVLIPPLLIACYLT